jgi:hypothetical protein
MQQNQHKIDTCLFFFVYKYISCEPFFTTLMLISCESPFKMWKSHAGSELYVCLTTMHGDGGWFPIFESFCFLGGEPLGTVKL